MPPIGTQRLSLGACQSSWDEVKLRFCQRLFERGTLSSLRSLKADRDAKIKIH